MSSKLTPTALPTPPKDYNIGYMDRLVKQIALEFTKSRAVTPITCGSDLSGEAGFLISGLTIVNPPVSSTGSPPDGFPEGSVWCDTTSENSLKIITSGPYTDQDSLNLANTTDPALGDALIGFRQSNASGILTGAVGRTVHDKLQETVSVKDFGAVGDGVTDDTAAIQAAIDANQNGIVLFPTGEYLCSATIILTDANGHNFQGMLSGANAEITFTNSGSSANTDAAMQHGFRAYPLTNGAGGDITGMRDVVIEGLRIAGPLHGASVYAANSQNVTIQNCQFSQSRYGVAMECCINAKIIDNVFDTHFNAGVGMIMSGNTANVWYGSVTPATTQWNDSPLIQGNGFLSSSLSSTLAHILDSGSNSESTRLIQGNFFYSRWDGSGPFISTQYGYLGRGGNTTMTRNWFENIPYPVRILNTNAAEGITNVPGVSGAEPSGTFALSNLVTGFSYNGNFKGNWFARSLISMELSGITGGPCEIGQNISQLLQNGGVHVKSTQSGDTLIVDNGDVIISPVGTYSYKSLFSQSTYTSLYSKFASYTPTVSAGTGTLTTYTVNEAKFCKTRPDFVTVILDITINNNGTGATDLRITLPVDFSALIGSASGRAFVGNSYTMTGIISSTGIVLTKYDGSYPVVTGDRFIITGQYLVS